MAHSGRQIERVARRRLSDLAETPELRRLFETSFPGLWDRFSAAAGGPGASRREFLKLMGASLALAGLTGCRWPKETIVPATRQPVDRVPGVPVQYATAIELAGVATGLLVTSYDGRPIKIEGNDQHPFSRGKTSAWMQASLLDLYDPDRSQRVVQRVTGSGGSRRLNRTWEEFDAEVGPRLAELRADRGKGLCVLVAASASPSLTRLRAQFQQLMPEAGWINCCSTSQEAEHIATGLVFGNACRPQLDLTKADVIVALDSDFLMQHPAAVRYAADFATRRRADDGAMSRLYVAESTLTVTGAAADRRFPLRRHEIGRLAACLAKELLDRGLPWPDGVGCPCV